MREKILVTGANGLLGSEIVKLLSENKFDVIGVARTEAYSSGAEIITYQDVKKLDTNNVVYKVINCAFPRSSEYKTLVEGIEFTRKLISDLKRLNPSFVINISSQSVYNQNDTDIPSELSQVNPSNIYGLSKYFSEILFKSTFEGTETVITNIRLASLMGLHFNVRMPNKFVAKAFNEEEITISKGTQKISYLDVRDASTALMKMLISDCFNWKDVYNLGNESYFSLSGLIEEIESHMKNPEKLKVNITEEESDFSNLIDSKGFMEEFNWQPRYDITLFVEELFKNAYR